MKFLLKFVSCCVSPPSRKKAPELVGKRTAVEETKASVGQQKNYSTNSDINNHNIRNKKKREWKPTLCAICENNVVVVVAEEKVVKKKQSVGVAKNSSRHKSSLATSYGESRRNYYGSPTPSFSPTPFLF